MKKIIQSALFIALLGSISGCSTVQLNSTVSPGVSLGGLKKFYVVHLPQDSRNVDRLIADRLNTMGRQATYGEKSGIPADVDAVFTYQDKWMWDITMYMIELNVQVRQPKTDFAIATGHSLRTSLQRKSPSEMVEEVLTDMFKK